MHWTPKDPWTPFVYRAHVGRSFGDEAEPVVDGDTIWFRIDKGFYDFHVTDVRLLTVDTREISFVSHDSEEYERGMKHREFVVDWLEQAEAVHDGDWPFLLKTRLGEQSGTYGRVLAEVWGRSVSTRERNLADALLAEFDDVEVYD